MTRMGARVAAFALLLALGKAVFANPQETVRKFTFRSVEISPFSESGPGKDPIYRVHFKEGDPDRSEIMLESQLRTIAKYLGKEKPEELLGLSFDSDQLDPYHALDHFFHVAKANGAYRSPSLTEFTGFITTGLAAGSCPAVLESFDKNSIYQNLSRALNVRSDQPNAPWSDNLATQVRAQSGNRYEVKISKKKDVFGRIWRGDGEYYQLTENGKIVLKFYLSAASNGFDCEKAPSEKPSIKEQVSAAIERLSRISKPAIPEREARIYEHSLRAPKRAPALAPSTERAPNHSTTGN